MARTGRPKAPLTVTCEQRAALERGARAATSTQAYALRCKIVLACAEPEAFNYQVAADLGVSVPTVTKWRGRVAREGPGRPAGGGRPRPPPPGPLVQGAAGLAAPPGGRPPPPAPPPPPPPA